MNEYSVTKRLPNNGQEVLCYGNKTFCCKLDMEEASWHKVIFNIEVSQYKLKNSVPEDPEETILEFTKVIENWNCIEDDEENWRVIGVTKWMPLPKVPE